MTDKEPNEMRVLSSDYMHWAKTQADARFNLATSGMPNVALADLPVKLDELEITTSSPYGYPPLIEAIAAHAGVQRSASSQPRARRWRTTWRWRR